MNSTQTIVLIIVVTAIVILILAILRHRSLDIPSTDCLRNRSTSRSWNERHFVKGSRDSRVPTEDRKSAEYLYDFFVTLRDRSVNKVQSWRRRAKTGSHRSGSCSSSSSSSSSSCECPPKTCAPFFDLAEVSFTEVPVVGAYGVNLLVQRYSSGTGGKDVLFLHGLPSSFLSMRNAFMNPWLLSHHNVHTMQHRGIGAGPYPDPFGPQGGYHLTVTWADDVNATILALGFTPGNVVLVCHSFGIIVAADYIRKYGQEMLAGVFISNPYPEPIGTPYGFSSYIPDYLALTLDVFTNGWVPDAQGWKTFLTDGLRFNDEHRHHVCEMTPHEGVEWGVHAGILRGDFIMQSIVSHEPTPNLSTNGPPNPDLSDRLTTGVWPFVTVPVHVLGGWEDKLLQPTTAVDVHNAIPGSKLTMIECAGHEVYVDNPDKYNSTLRKFLQEELY